MPSNSEKITATSICRRMFARTFRRPRCAMPITASCTSCWRRAPESRPESQRPTSPPSSENRFCPTKRECRKCSNSSASMSRCSTRSRDLVRQRPVIARSAPCAAAASASAPEAGCACTRSRFCRSTSGAGFRESRAAWPALLPVGIAQSAGEKLAVQIPDGQPVGRRVQLGVMGWLRAQRIEIRDQMPAHAVRVDQLDHAPLPWRSRRVAPRSARGLAAVRSVSQRTGDVRHVQIGEDVVVEIRLRLAAAPAACPETRPIPRPESSR